MSEHHFFEQMFNRAGEYFAIMPPGMSDELLEACGPHVGRWVITLGDDIIGVGDTPSEALAAVPRGSQTDLCFPVRWGPYEYRRRQLEEDFEC